MLFGKRIWGREHRAGALWHLVDRRGEDSTWRLRCGETFLFTLVLLGPGRSPDPASTCSVCKTL